MAKGQHPYKEHHQWVLANCLAQTKALSFGRGAKELQDKENIREDLLPFQIFEGQRPNTTIILKELNPFTLGMLMAFYEHQVFSLGHLQNIYSFDQWGVELGKTLAQDIYHGEKTDFDASTNKQREILRMFSNDAE